MAGAENSEQSFNPSVDILIGLVAIVLMITVSIVPLAQLNIQRQKVSEVVQDDIRTPLGLTHAGKTVLQIIASSDRITLVSEAGNAQILLDDLFDNSILRARLDIAKRQSAQPVLFVEKTGQEAAFLLETLFAAAGFEDISRVYLEEACGYFQTERRPAACGFGGEP